MKQIRLLCVVLAAAAVTSGSPVLAQESQTRAGVGVSLEPARLFMTGSMLFSYATTPVAIYVPIDVSEHVRIEPDGGVFSASSETSQSGFSSTEKSSTVRVGCGLFYVTGASDNVRLYVGPRAGFYFVSSKSSSTNPLGSSSSERSETDFAISLAAGGEYSLSTRFSIGGEAQGTYISFGQPEVTTTPAPFSTTASDRSQSVLTTNVLFFARWYF